MTPLEYFDIEAAEFSSLETNVKSYYLDMAFSTKSYEWTCLNNEEKNRANALYAAHLIGKNPKYGASSVSDAGIFLKKKSIGQSNFEYAEKNNSSSISKAIDGDYYLSEYNELVKKCGFGKTYLPGILIATIKR